MAIEPSKKVTETQIIRREENTAFQQKKKQQTRKQELIKDQDRSGKVDIKV
jgi:hypothetical protein